METITHAAIIKNAARCIIYGKTHAECMRKSIREFKIPEHCPQCNQGFLTDNMRFVSRHKASEIAIAAGQIDKKFRNKTLISEHFWSKDLGGKHIYDSVLGYIIPACPENSSENKK